jgi:hypothetical protein
MDCWLSIAGKSTKTVEWYNPTINEWTYGASLINEHVNGAAVVLNNRIIVCGGLDRGDANDRTLSMSCIPPCEWHDA